MKIKNDGKIDFHGEPYALNGNLSSLVFSEVRDGKN